MRTHASESAHTVVDLLRTRAREQPDRRAYLFLDRDGLERESLTFAALDRRAMAIAARIRRHAAPGDRVLILHPPSLEYIACFFGCLYAGVVAVTAYPPNFTRRLERIRGLVRDSAPALALTTDRISTAASARFTQAEELVGFEWLDTATVGTAEAAGWCPPRIDGDSLAFLQYTSGTTGDPRGVMVSHGNLLRNASTLHDALGYHPGDRMVSWLPPYHDMGLIAGVLQPVHGGFEAVLLAPATFALDPFQWLQAISRYGGTTSFAPDFAYNLCTDRIDEERRAGLDLSTWTSAVAGAEPTRVETLRRFAEAFAGSGFRPEAFRSGYGLAESTLAVTITRTAPAELDVSASALERGEVTPATDGTDRRRLVSVGPGIDPAQSVVVVDAADRRLLPAGAVGEVWVSGPSVAQGYWRRPEQTHETFQARVTTGEGPFLRTGDLGFVHDGELFVTGRIKDMIIVRGRNLYPQDVERCAVTSHPALRSGLAAAAGLDTEAGEQLLVVAEVRRDATEPDVDGIVAAIRQAVTAEFDVAVHAVVLVRAGTLPRTSSGKVQRHAAKRGYAAGDLTELARWTAVEPSPTRDRPAPAEDPATSVVEIDTGAVECATGPTGPGATRADGTGRADGSTPLRDLLDALPEAMRTPVVSAEICRRIAATPGVDAAAVTPGTPLTLLGLDSLRALQVQSDLERDLAVRLPLEEFAESTVDQLARLVTARLAGPRADDPAGVTVLPALVADPDRRGEPFPLTDLQHAYLVGRSGATRLGGVSTYWYTELDSASLDVPRLVRALGALVERHEMLRAVIGSDGTQRILAVPGTVPVREIDLRDASLDEADEALAAVREEMSHQVLPLDTGPMLDVRISRLPLGHTRVHIGFDLLVGDVRSVQILFDEWRRWYLDPDATLPEIGVSFRDYLLAARALEAGPGYARSRAYWLDRLDTLPGGPDLPLAPTAAELRRSRFHRHEHRIDAGTWSRIKRDAAAHGVTPSAVLLAAYASALGRWSGTSRFCVATTLFNRLPLHPDVDAVVGDFTSITLLEIDLGGSPALGELAIRIQRQLWRDLEHRHFSGVQVLREQARRRGAALPVPVVFTSGRDNGEIHTRWLGDTAFSVSQTPQIWIDHQVREEDGAALVSWDAVDELFPDGLVEQMFAGFVDVLNRLGSGTGWTGPAEVSPAGLAELVAGVNATQAPIPSGLLWTRLVEHATAHPDDLAVVASGRHLTFGQLLSRASFTAHRLVEAGVTRGDQVAVIIDKSVEQIIAVLAAGLAGAAYVPVDPSTPPDRQEYVLTHAECTAVLVRAGTSGHPGSGLPILVVNADDDTAVADTPPAVATQVQPDDLAYIIYTSGSTGRPKGVAICHRAAVNTCVDVNNRYHVTANDAVLGLSALSFDLSVWDIFGALATGATLVLPEPDANRDPARWHHLITQHHITLWNSVPALMAMLVEHLEATGHTTPTLRRVLLSGDWIPTDLPHRITTIAPHAKTTSLGGATEAAIWSILHDIDHVDPTWDSIPYGRPMTNQTFHVLNDRHQECPTWVTGHLHIGGTGLANGYHNDPHKTANAFITHPTTGQRLYRTGDLGRRLPDGTIEFAGRTDHQVKIGGHRIELGDIEHTLTTHPAVETAIATATGDRHHRRLTAYIITNPEHHHDPHLTDTIRTHAATHLPPYMIPTTITILDTLPLTPNGKIDRNNLPEPGIVVADHTPPRTPLERTVATQLGQVLGTPQVCVRSNFFELGLDSVLILRLHRELRTALGRDFPLTLLFEHTSVRRLSGVLTGTDDGDADLDAAFARGQRNRRARRRVVRSGQEEETRS
ncbi:non-ribosomal peptide synthetase [Micromonospora endolithica]|uniref:Phenyloxazoline synthase MbtB n=1 Tax=Micromonospora endolithica TaxID=230091 RepID=A0A3A9ZBR6_9ACTN|nr:non-ribosomal peptide synthetase [Micromonospora endolithica]RKN45334.1 amino acid adenylation domain-containing protein [Micromonospora endolithica]TWJ22971.1 amino acid adenylation domain-containing protein [Micromonospora endolithica]